MISSLIFGKNANLLYHIRPETSNRCRGTTMQLDLINHNQPQIHIYILDLNENIPIRITHLSSRPQICILFRKYRHETKNSIQRSRPAPYHGWN